MQSNPQDRCSGALRLGSGIRALLPLLCVYVDRIHLCEISASHSHVHVSKKRVMSTK